MGCCSSKVPSFPVAPRADEVVFGSQPSDFDAQLVKLVPHSSMMRLAVAVYLPNDYDKPTYFFQRTKLFKSVLGDKEEVASINMRNRASPVVTTKVNGVEDNVKLGKDEDSSQGGPLGSGEIQISNGYSAVMNEQNKCLELSLNGNQIAHVYDKNMTEGRMGLPMMDMASVLNFVKAPVVVYLNRNLNETAIVRTLAIIAALNDRLIMGMPTPDAQSPHHNDYNQNDDYNNNYHYNDDHGGGDYGGGDDGGGGGWGGGGDGGGGDGGGGDGGGGGGGE